MFWRRIFLCLTVNIVASGNIHYFHDPWSQHDGKYGSFPESRRLQMVDKVRDMFQFGYDNYMKYAFPQDELDPIHCTGRGPDYDNPSNININDVLGDYALTLIDSLDTLAIMGNSSEFQLAVQNVIDHVTFDKPSTVQVFEATIRVLGALLSAHLLITDPIQPFGQMAPADYDNELLSMAHDLAARLLPAFEETATGIPYPRVHLQEGVPFGAMNTTCTSGAGTLLLEFGMLSRLLQDPVYESVARRAVKGLWSFRSNVTGLFGNVINIQTGEWVGRMSGLGAGLDSFFEYLLKSFILFGEESDLHKFNESYETIKYYMRRGRRDCNDGSGYPPIYVNVNMKDGEVVNNWIDALQAAWPGVQVLNGDLEEAICTHALFYTIWRRFGGLPERYNWNMKVSEVHFYPLRPELVESTYLLYRATKNPFYLHVGEDIVNSLNNHTKAECGYATVHNVNDKDLEDRMESFFLSETCKYLYLLFDTENHLNKHSSSYLFTTEGHIFPIDRKYRQRPWEEAKPSGKEAKPRDRQANLKHQPQERGGDNANKPVVVDTRGSNITNNCEKIPEQKKYFLPIKSRYLEQLENMVGLT